MPNTFIDIQNISFSYDEDNSSDKIFDNFSLKIAKGDFIALIGHNGCGKSTLSKLLNGLYLPQTGNIFVDGMDTKDDNLKYEIRKKLGLVFQNPDNQIVASVVEEDVAFGPENLGLDPLEIRKRVDYALKTVDMYEHRLKAPYNLSGGQKQRVAIAGIIAMQPDCIVLDEPTSMLDPKGCNEVMNTIINLNKNFNITVILITHNMKEAALAKRVIVLDKGRIISDGKPREVFSNVDLLKKFSLSVPQATELAYLLKGYGFNLPDGILDEYECAVAVSQMLEDLKCR